MKEVLRLFLWNYAFYIFVIKIKKLENCHVIGETLSCLKKVLYKLPGSYLQTHRERQKFRIIHRTGPPDKFHPAADTGS